ncbi:MAG: Denitrification regulatory protein NirQ, partial [Planctomycetota bacterium]
NLDFSTRDGINILRYALKRMAQDPDHPLSRDDAWRESVLRCLGEDAADLQSLADKRNTSLGGNAVPMGLGDFFFSPDDPLHPDADFDDEDDFDEDDGDEDDFDDTNRKRGRR